MNHKEQLLNELRIDRGDETETFSGGRPAAKLALVITLALVAVAGGWWVAGSHRGVPASAATAVAVEVETPGPTQSARASALDASGYVVARRQATVSAKITGRVLEMLIEEGQRVAAGEIIARLDDSTALAALDQTRAHYAHAAAELAAAGVALEDAWPTFARNERQFAAAVISEQEFDEVKARLNALAASVAVKERALGVAAAGIALAERNVEDTVVRAPFDGVVTVKAAQAGEIVSPSSAGGGFTRTGLGTIVDMSSLEVEVDVSESFIDRVRAGQPARVRLNAYPSWEIPAQVIAVVPTADRAKATVKVRVGFEESDDRVLPEMGVRVSFLGPAAGEKSDAAGAARRAAAVPAEPATGTRSSGVDSRGAGQ